LCDRDFGSLTFFQQLAVFSRRSRGVRIARRHLDRTVTQDRGNREGIGARVGKPRRRSMALMPRAA